MSRRNIHENEELRDLAEKLSGKQSVEEFAFAVGDTLRRIRTKYHYQDQEVLRELVIKLAEKKLNE